MIPVVPISRSALAHLQSSGLLHDLRLIKAKFKGNSKYQLRGKPQRYHLPAGVKREDALRSLERKVEVALSRDLPEQPVVADIYRTLLSDSVSPLHDHGIALLDVFTKGFRFYRSLNELRQAYAHATWDLVGTSDVGAWFDHDTGIMHLDGGSEPYQLNAREIYAHEVAHAIDGDYSLSTSPQWVDAWIQEVVTQPSSKNHFTDRGRSFTTEGFAEFGQLVINWPHDAGRYPQCLSFWRRYGLIH